MHDIQEPRTPCQWLTWLTNMCPASQLRHVVKLETQLTKMDEQYDLCNGAMAQGEVHGYNAKFPGCPFSIELPATFLQSLPQKSPLN